MDEEFEPRLGRMRSPGSRRGSNYLRRVVKATTLAGQHPVASRSRFTGSRIGRGVGTGRLLRSSASFAQGRRAIVKTRLVRLARGSSAALAHLRYIERDGAQRDGSPGAAYSAAEDRANGKEFLQRCDGDRHQFRMIVSAEDGADYDDLKPLVRRFMQQMEKDLGTRLDWIAVDHSDTAHPHSHIMLRGRDDRGQNLVISPEYLSHGMRERLSEIVTRDLGPRQQREIDRKLRQEVSAERLTSIDRSLLNEVATDGSVAPSHPDPFRNALRAGRLKKLEALGLAAPLGSGRWRLVDHFDDRLRALGERGDIVRTMQRALKQNGIERAHADLAVSPVPHGGLTGRILARGLADELGDRHYLLVDATDGRVHHVDIGAADAVESLPAGSIIEIRRAVAAVRESDRRIAGIAAASNGRYSPQLHRAADPSASDSFIAAHVRRLEAMKQARVAVERNPDGSWMIGDDHVEAARAYEEGKLRRAPAKVELLSPLPVGELPRRDGATWLDRELESGNERPLRDSGFGREVRAALALRRQWLVENGLAEQAGDGIVLRAGALKRLERRELTAAAQALDAELGKPGTDLTQAPVVHGRLTRRVDLASGRFALVESEGSFALVPWRPVLERHLGKDVEASIDRGRVDWHFGRQRSGPALS